MESQIKNLIIISIDNLRPDCIEANPNKQLLNKYKLSIKPKTPTLDWFVNNGVFFNQCITVAPYTTTAHASILTGQWPHKHGIIDFFGSKLSTPTIFEILRKEKFSTLFQADFPFILGPNMGFDKGIDKFVDSNENESYEWIKKNIKKPLACFFHFANVHSPYGFHDLTHDGNNYRKKVNSLIKKYKIKPDIKALDGKQYIMKDLSNEEKILKQNYDKVLQKIHELKQYDQIMDLYIEGINYFEKYRFKNFINSLTKIGLLKNSLVVIVGDHGEGWDENNMGHNKGKTKYGLIDEMIKVPLIFYHPAIEKQFRKEQIGTIDIVPSIMNLINAPYKNNKFNGIDLFNSKNKKLKLTAYSQIWSSDSAEVTILMNKIKNGETTAKPKYQSHLATATIRKNGYKLIVNYSENGKKTNYRFYDITQTEKEIMPQATIADNLKNKLKKYNQLTIDKNLKGRQIKNKNKEEIAKQLRLLGYNV